MNDILKQEIERERALLVKEVELQKLEEKEALEKSISEITPAVGVVKVDDVKLPINTGPNVLHVKFPYKEYAYITLESNFDQQDNKHNKERYIYDNKLNFAEIAKALGGTRQTISKNIKKLEEKGVLVKDPINPKVYKIRYTFEGKGDYITIHKDILQKLADLYKSDVIALYCWLCVNLRTGKKVLTREFICEGIGLKPTSRNLDKISSITTSLENEGLIGKEIEYNIRRGQRKDIITYILATPEEYKQGIFRIRKAMRDKTKLEKKGIEI